MRKKIIIIGGGLAGMAAGIYGRMNGYDTTILEMHSIPGGMCTAWKRKGYTIEGCFHWWLGSIPESSFYPFFEDLGIHPHTRVLEYDQFSKFVDPSGETFTIYNDLEKLQTEMLRVAPEDKAAITQTIGEIRLLSGFKAPVEKAPELFSFFDILKLILGAGPDMKLFMKYNKISVAEFSERFTNPMLRKFWNKMFYYDVLPAAPPLMTLAAMSKGDGSIPEGGSLAFMDKIEKRYTGLGGEILYNSRVSKIITQNGEAKGVKLEDGREFSGDIVISAADGYSTIFKMLEGRFVDKKIKDMYTSMELFESILQISIGVDTDLSHQPHSVRYLIKDEVRGVSMGPLWIEHFCADPGAAPKGKSVIRVIFDSPFDYWNELHKDKTAYKEVKKEVAQRVISHLEKIYPEIKDKVEMIDVATPTTYVRYTDVHRGAFEGWLPSVSNLSVRVKKTLPGLKNFYMTGQWVAVGGGVPNVVMSGRDVIQIICKEDRKKFQRG